jgi:hypothetical protein
MSEIILPLTVTRVDAEGVTLEEDSDRRTMNKPLTSEQKIGVLSLQLKMRILQNRAQEIELKSQKELHEIDTQLAGLSHTLAATLNSVARENGIDPKTHELNLDLEVVEKQAARQAA